MLDETPMIEETLQSAAKGVRIGLLCGLIFGFAATVGAVLVGYEPLMPLRLGASVLLGEGALTEAPARTVIVVGLIVHFAVSVYYGLLFGLTHQRFIHTEWMKNWHRLALGCAFGLMVWAINFQLIARALYPWFLHFIQSIIAVIHVAFYGLPLAMMYIRRDRRATQRAQRSAPGHA